MDTKNPILISRSELVALLIAKKGSAPISVVCATDPLDSKMRITDNPFLTGCKGAWKSTIRKVGKSGGMINAQYDKMVEKRVGNDINAERVANGDAPLEGPALLAAIDERFRKGESWHQPYIVDGRVTALSCHVKSPESPDYLRFVVQSSSDKEYVAIADGEDVDAELVAPFMPDNRNSYGNQGLDNEKKVRFIVWKMASIIDIKIGGEIYRVSDNIEQYPMQTRRKLFGVCDEYLNGERSMSKVGT